MSNPITNIIDLSNFGLFTKKPILSPDAKLVLASTNGGYILINDVKQISRGELMSGKYSKLIEISTFPVAISHNGEYPSKDLVNRFVFELNAKCIITSPIDIAKNNETDIQKTVMPIIIAVLKQIALENEIEDYTQLSSNITYFENKVNAKLDDYGMELTKLTVIVKPDNDYIAHKKNKVTNQREKETTLDKNNLQKDVMESQSQVKIRGLELDNEYNDKLIQTILKYYQEGNQYLLPFVYKDDLNALKMVQDMKDKMHSDKKEDLEWMLELGKKYDYDINELRSYQNNSSTGKIASKDGSTEPNKTITEKKDSYEPKELENEED